MSVSRQIQSIQSSSMLPIASATVKKKIQPRRRQNLSYLNMPERKRRYSPTRKDTSGNPILEPITDDILALVDREQINGTLRGMIPPGFTPL